MATTITPKNLRAISQLQVNANEIELMAALESNDVKVNTLSDEDLSAFCHDAEVIREKMDSTDETRFTLYDLIEALIEDMETTDHKNFESEDDWYDNLIDVAIKQRDRYSNS